MSQTEVSGGVHRRSFLIAAGAGSAAFAAAQFAPGIALADKALTEQAIKKVIGDRKPIEGRVSIDGPEIAENGNTVPVGFEVESKMSGGDMVKAVHVFAEGNPRPEVANFWFSADSGAARGAFRMRMAKTQNLIAVAEMADGKVYMGKRLVKVTIGGCGG
ncbi:MAG: thiosulfate oxidation carrier protein SoxY [Rhodospirillaceae bacterium]|nr:thiosulfate oxidation carrier protein SoxY [Rhodospirillaceae bacterium]MDE0704913.1 thiosulfate oxidation carrier protein SoxY [Rhodospirillaceae bacterium]